MLRTTGKLGLAPPLLLALAGCGGEPETVYETVEVTVTRTEPHTVVETVTVTDPDLDPGRYSPVLVEIQRLQDNSGAVGSNNAGENHMHISEMLYRPADKLWDDEPYLAYCSYTFGILDASSPGSMSFEAQGFEHSLTDGTRTPGCIHLAWDEADPTVIYTTHHGNIDDGSGFISGWMLGSLSDPAPVEIPQLLEEDVAPEGIDHANGYLWVALHQDGLGVYAFDGATISRVASLGGFENAWDVIVDGDVAYVCDGVGGLVSVDVSDPLKPTQLSRVVFDGQARDIDLNGSYAYVAAESGGLVTVDVSDPMDMKVLHTEDVTGGSAIAVAYDQDKVFLAAWVDSRVYDVSDPTEPRMLGGVRTTVGKNYSDDGGDRPDITSRVLGVDGYGDYLFAGTWWVPFNYQVHADRQAPYMVLPEEVNLISFPGDLNAGQSSSVDLVIRNEGTAPLTVYDVWADVSSFTASPAQLQIDPLSEGVITLTFTAAVGVDANPGTTTPYGEPFSALEDAILSIRSDDPNQPLRQGYLVGNADGVSVGDPMPETTGTLLDGSPWSFQADALGDVTVLAYFATF